MQFLLSNRNRKQKITEHIPTSLAGNTHLYAMQMLSVGCYQNQALITS